MCFALQGAERKLFLSSAGRSGSLALPGRDCGEGGDRTTNQPVSSQCPVALSTLGWHLLGLTKLPQPLQDVTACCALPCLPGPGALAGIMSMKETENVFIETQAAKSAKQNKVPLSGGDRDPGLLDWALFYKS